MAPMRTKVDCRAGKERTIAAHDDEAAVHVVLQALRVQVAGAQVLDGQRQALAVRHVKVGAQRLDVDGLRQPYTRSSQYRFATRRTRQLDITTKW